MSLLRVAFTEDAGVLRLVKKRPSLAAYYFRMRPLCAAQHQTGGCIDEPHHVPAGGNDIDWCSSGLGSSRWRRGSIAGRPPGYTIVDRHSAIGKSVFDVTPDEISQLNDVDLRELLGRLCEAELTSRRISSASVTWGGNQTAPDGGLDVRVRLPEGASIDGHIPRRSTGFQVKKPDMARAAIIDEMKPAGTIRPVIRELAGEGGAYVIVSSAASTSDTGLRNRKNAMREALNGVIDEADLHTDFYDRTRLAGWVRCHPGLIAWVKERVGRAFAGWRGYGSWIGSVEGVEAEYLLDDKLRLQIGRGKSPSKPVVEAIDDLRDELAMPGKIVRLVGLSGVGKTRLVQALFDARIASRPLSPSLAVYTNLSDDPTPQPTGLASDLIANRTRAILIVDNCPPDLHRRLSELCRGQASTVSVITVEYDVRDDQPEGTEVATLDTSSPELIEKLIRHRYSHISQVDARTIAEASGGNARVAISLGETVDRGDSIAGLSNDELFQRLFRQRQDPSDALLRAARAFSLVYSFHGAALTGDEAELPRLAAIAGHSATEMFGHAGELIRRNLVQQRGVWRAVLPHAIANRLAARALEDTPYQVIEQHLLDPGAERVARSFSRRLSFLHGHTQAVAIVEGWLKPGGLLGDVKKLNELGHAMFKNVAPVQPTETLAALRRGSDGGVRAMSVLWRQYLPLLRSLAYEPELFEHSAQLLADIATGSTDEPERKQASETFASLFTIYLSGTHAPIELRLKVIEGLLKSANESARGLGLTSLDKTLEATHFSSGYRFDFGARSRDYGSAPGTRADIVAWFGAALGLIDRLALSESVLTAELRDLLARRFRGLWSSAQAAEQLEPICRKFGALEFWREGWVASRTTLRFDAKRLPSDVVDRLTKLKDDLGPRSLADRVRAVALGKAGGLDLDDEWDTGEDLGRAVERAEESARDLGVQVASAGSELAELLPELAQGGNRTFSFGIGLARGSSDPVALWTTLVGELERLPAERRNVQVLRGFLAGLWERDGATDRDLVRASLDAALEQPALAASLPVLETAIEFDDAGVDRVTRGLRRGVIDVETCRNLAWGRTADGLTGSKFNGLLLSIAEIPGGFDVALEILAMRLHSDRGAKRDHDPEILRGGRSLLRKVTFGGHTQRHGFQLGVAVQACIAGPEGAADAAKIARRLREAVAAYETSGFEHDDLVAALLEHHPVPVLDALFSGGEEDRAGGLRVFDYLEAHAKNPADVVPIATLVAWCDTDPESRYPLVASIVTFATSSGEGGSLAWTEQAKALFARETTSVHVLAEFVKRFRPMTWSGSRGAIMEANGRLLDEAHSFVPASLISLVDQARLRLAEEIAEERQSEMERDRTRDERFE